MHELVIKDNGIRHRCVHNASGGGDGKTEGVQASSSSCSCASIRMAQRQAAAHAAVMMRTHPCVRYWRVVMLLYGCHNALRRHASVRHVGEQNISIEHSGHQLSLAAAATNSAATCCCVARCRDSLLCGQHRNQPTCTTALLLGL
jgi:hypothetical protein